MALNGLRDTSNVDLRRACCHLSSTWNPVESREFTNTIAATWTQIYVWLFRGNVLAVLAETSSLLTNCRRKIGSWLKFHLCTVSAAFKVLRGPSRCHRRNLSFSTWVATFWNRLPTSIAITLFANPFKRHLGSFWNDLFTEFLRFTLPSPSQLC